MTNEIKIAFTYALHDILKNGVPPSFKEVNSQYESFYDMNIYYADNDSIAGDIKFMINNGQLGNTWLSYGNGYPICPQHTFASVFKGRGVYIASKKDKTKWVRVVSPVPEWKYNVDEWNTYFRDAFDSNWDDVGKYLYEKKSSIWCDLHKHTYRNEDSDVRWVIMKDGMLMNLANHSDKSEFDGTVTLRGIPIQFIMLHILPRVSKFVSKVEVIGKLKDRARHVNEYAKSVYAMTSSGDIVEYNFTSCRMWGNDTKKNMDVGEIQSIIDNPKVWVKWLGVLKRVPLQ